MGLPAPGEVWKLKRMKRLLIFALAFGGMALAPLVAVADTSPVVSASTQVNKDKALTRALEVPVLLADRSDPNLVYQFNVEMLNGQCRFYLSRDHGYTWTEGTAPSLPPYTDCGPGSSQPLNFRTTMAQASDGTLLLAYAAHDDSAGGSRSVLLARSHDKGSSWQVVAVDPGPPASQTGHAEVNFEPHVAVNPDNAKQVFVIWRRSYPTIKGVTLPATRPWMAESTDGGATFGSPFMAFDTNIKFDPPYPVIVGGTLYASYLNRGIAASSGAPTPPDKITVGITKDGGKTWTTSTISSGPGADTPIILYDATRKKFNVFWDDTRNGDYDVFYSSSTDAQTWTNPVRLNDDPKSNGRDQLLPAATLSPDGRLSVAWYDYRNDPYPLPAKGDIGNRTDVYLTSSTDGGTTWSANVRADDFLVDRLKGLTNNEYFLQIPPGLASGAGWVDAAWTDTRNGDQISSTQDIYASVIAYDPSLIPAGQPGAPSPGYSGGQLALVAVVIGLAGVAGGAGVALLVSRRPSRRETPAQVP